MIYVKVATIIIRSVFAFIILLVLGRITGRKMISRITFFDFIIGVTLGSLGVRLALGSENTFGGSVVSGITIIFMVLITDYLNLKSYIFRKLEEGKPIILIDNGQILDKNLKKVRISLSKLVMLLREKNVFNIDDVNFAIIESDGQLSILLKSNMQNIKATDLNIAAKPTSLPLDLIIDGKIIYKNLQQSGHDKQWITNQLKKLNIVSEKDVFYACLNSTQNLYVSAKIKKAI